MYLLRNNVMDIINFVFKNFLTIILYKDDVCVQNVRVNLL